MVHWRSERDAARYANRTRGLVMERKRINSSRIRAVGYDPRTQTLEVEFSDGRVMAYSGVSAEVHRRFLAAPSPVSFYEDRIAEEYSARRL
jgi:hypothetical protein